MNVQHDMKATGREVVVRVNRGGGLTFLREGKVFFRVSGSAPRPADAPLTVRQMAAAVADRAVLPMALAFASRHRPPALDGQK
jgi:ApbE superfamily uncharacterized protein (UPF0280 family)